MVWNKVVVLMKKKFEKTFGLQNQWWLKHESSLKMKNENAYFLNYYYMVVVFF